MNFNSRAASLSVSSAFVFFWVGNWCCGSLTGQMQEYFSPIAGGNVFLCVHCLLQEVRQGGGGYLLVSTDIAARGIDLPETTHIYNFDLPRNAVDYLHRAGRTGRKPFSEDKCIVTNIITSEELFVLQRFENELKFDSEELNLQAQCLI